MSRGGHRMLRRAVTAMLACACAWAAGTPATASAASVGNCTRFADPAGSDKAPGSAKRPVRSAQKLVDLLGAGDTGCLERGTYGGGITFRRPGLPEQRIELRPRNADDRVIVSGRVVVQDSADFVTVRGLRLDGTNRHGKPSPLINASDVVFTANNVSNASDSCFVLGDTSWGVARRTLIEANQIHHCGVDGTNQDHGVYIRQAMGTRVIGNVIHSNPDRGVQMFPNADASLISGNVIDGNGEGVIFSGDGVGTSDHNMVSENLITYSDLRWDVEHYWLSGLLSGLGNVVSGNCVWGGRRGTFKRPVAGYAEIDNLETDPLYASRSGGDYRLRGGTPCPVAPPVLPDTAR